MNDKKEELKTIDASSFKDCVPKMISHEAHAHPDMPHDQVVAVAHAKCRKRFGMSKAQLFRLFEYSGLLKEVAGKIAKMLDPLQESKIIDEETLSDLVSQLRNSLEREDLIDYSVILKTEGFSLSDIEDLIDYSKSWVRKYVNPRYREVTQKKKVVTMSQNDDKVTQNETVASENEKLAKERDEKIILDFYVSEIRKDERYFEGWATVEIKDSQGELLPVAGVEGLESIMPIFMSRGAPITYGHSNRVVGRFIDYEIKDKAVNGRTVPAIYVKGNIFHNYEIDDNAWEAIQIAKQRDLPVLSIAATPTEPPTKECNEIECFIKHKNLQMYEVAVTEIQHGSMGANPEAKIEVAKQEEQTMQPSDKRYIGAQMAGLKRQDKLPDPDSLVELMLSTCNACQSEYEAYLAKGKSDREAKALLFTDIMKAIYMVEQEAEIPDEEEDKTKTKSADKQKQELGGDLTAVFQEIRTELQAIRQALTPKPEETEEPKPEEKPEDKKPEEKKKDQPPTQSLSDEDFLALAKKKGFVKAESPSPAPQVTPERRETQGAGLNKKKPEDEELYEALKKGNLDDVIAKYLSENPEQ